MAEVNVVGVFPNDEAARSALRTLDDAGFPPDRVGVVAGNVRQAREVAGSESPRIAIAGVVVGMVVGAVLGLASTMSVNSLAAAPLGMVMFALVGGFIGMLVGRTRRFRSGDSEKYEDAVDRGEALVTIHCEDDARDAARRALSDAGATTVRVEGTPEPV